MAKLSSKVIPQLFGVNEIDPNLVPTPVGEWAGGGAVTPSLDPEVLLANIASGFTLMTVKPTNDVILPPAGDMAALLYSFCYYITALQQSGIAEYSPLQEYNTNDYTKAPNGTKLYRSIQNANIGQPLTDTGFWEALDLLNLRQATTSQQGTLQIATVSDINAGTNNTKALTIGNLKVSDIWDKILVGDIKINAKSTLADDLAGIGNGTWLYCNGRSLLTADYPLLFNKIGYTYGGSGANFNIPDLRNRVIACASATEPINKKEGAKTHTLSEAELPVIRPKMQATSSVGGTGGDATRLKGSANPLGSALLSDGNTFTIQTTQSFGGGQPHNNMQPTIYLGYYIYAV